MSDAEWAHVLLIDLDRVDDRDARQRRVLEVFAQIRASEGRRIWHGLRLAIDDPELSRLLLAPVEEQPKPSGFNPSEGTQQPEPPCDCQFPRTFCPGGCQPGCPACDAYRARMQQPEPSPTDVPKWALDMIRVACSLCLRQEHPFWHPDGTPCPTPATTVPVQEKRR